MEEGAEQFISLVTRALDGADREAAADELRARISHAGGEAEASQAAGRLAGTGIPAPWRFTVAFGLILTGLAAVLAVLVPEHIQEARILQPVHGWTKGGNLPDVIRSFGARPPITASYLTDPRAWSAELEALLNARPPDVASRWFQTKAYRLSQPGESLPPDYEETWKALDPDNAAWPLAAAELFARKAHVTDGCGGFLRIDEPALEQSFEWLSKASTCNHAQTFKSNLREWQLGAFKPEPWLKSAWTESHLVGLSSWGAFTPNTFALRMKAGRLAAAGDTEGLRKLMADLHHALRLLAEASVVPSDLAIDMHYPGVPLLESSCRSVGLEAEAEWWERFLAMLRSKPGFTSGVAPPSLSQGASRHAASRVKSITYMITPEMLRPGRMTEYAVADRFAAVAGLFLAFIMLVLFAVEWLRRGRQRNGLATALLPLFRSVDWLWIAALGVAFPLVWWAAITWFTPLGCRDIGLTYFEIKGIRLMQPWLFQAAAGLLLSAVLLYQSCRWRWTIRGGFLSLGSSKLQVGWIVAAATALFVPLAGSIRYLPGHEKEFLLCVAPAAGIPLLWLIWHAGMAVVASPSMALGNRLLVRTLIPAACLLAAVLLSSLPLLRSNERSWFARDEFQRQGGMPAEVNRKHADLVRRGLLQALE